MAKMIVAAVMNSGPRGATWVSRKASATLTIVPTAATMMSCEMPGIKWPIRVAK